MLRVKNIMQLHTTIVQVLEHNCLLKVPSPWELFKINVEILRYIKVPSIPSLANFVMTE